jgi:hypothetical protein
VDDNTDPAFDRLLRALRRRWWVIAAFALAGAVLMAATASPSYDASATLLAVDESGPLDALKLPNDLVSRSAPVESDADALKQDSVGVDISKQVSGPVSEIVSADAQKKTIVLTVTSNTAKRAQDALSAYIAVASSHRVGQLTSAAKNVSNALDAQAAGLNERIDALDRLIEPLGPAQVSLSDAYRVERTRRADDLANVAAEQATLKNYLEANSSPFRVLSRTAPTTTTSGAGIQDLLLGGVLGMFLGLAALAAWTLLDRRVRSAPDLVRAGGVKLLAAFTDANEANAAAGIATQLAAVADYSTDSRFLMVSVNGHGLPERMRALIEDPLKRLLPDAVLIPAGGPATDAETLLMARETKQIILYVRWGESTEQEIARIVSAFQAGGSTVIGCALIDVPRRSLASALS